MREFGQIYRRANLLAARNSQVRTVRREYSDSLGANQNDNAQKDRKRSLESHLGPYPRFQRKKQTLSYTRLSVPRWQVEEQTHLSSSLTVNTRQFKFSPFSTCSAVLFIPHTNEDPWANDLSILNCTQNAVTYTWVNSHAHRRILAGLELQLISELQREEFIDMIKSLRNKAILPTATCSFVG